MKKQLDLTHGNILRGFLYFAFPLFLESLFQQLYGTVDLLFVGNILGTTDAAAVGASSILVTCLIGLFTGISVGAGVVIAAFTVYFKAENLIYLPIMAFGQAMVTFTGQNYGAGNSGRIKRGAIQCNLFSAAAVAFISWIILLLGRPLLALFCNELAVIEEGLKIIHISFPFYFLYAFLEVTGGIIRGLGKTVQSMMIVIVNLCVIRVLLLGILVNSFHTIQAVAFVYPATWFVAALSFIIYYIWLLYVKRIT